MMYPFSSYPRGYQLSLPLPTVPTPAQRAACEALARDCARRRKALAKNAHRAAAIKGWKRRRGDG